MTETDLADEATTALRRLVGDPSAEFRDGQLEAITALVADRRRVLVVQRTGWGKSAVYFVTTALLRARGAGPTLLVSPLLGLMRNQIDAAERGGIRAATINSDNQKLWDEVVERARGEHRRRAARLPRALRQPGVPRARAPDDRAPRRPARHRRGALHQRLGPRLPPRLPPARPRPRPPPPRRPRPRHDRHRERPGRRRRPGPARRGAPHHPRPARPREPSPSTPSSCAPSPTGSPGSRRCCRPCRAPGSSTRSPSPTRTGSPRGSASQGIEARAYTGETDTETKLSVESDLLANKIKAVVATSALGMGYDKPDLAFVVHYQSPGSADRLLPAGRSGRPWHRPGRGHPAQRPRGPRHPGLLHPHRVPRARAGRSRGRLLADAADWVPLHQIEDEVNVRRSRLERNAEEPRGRRRGRAGGPQVPAHPRAVDLRRGPGRAGHRAAPRRAGDDARLPPRRRLPHGDPAPPSSTTRPPSRAVAAAAAPARSRTIELDRVARHRGAGVPPRPDPRAQAPQAVPRGHDASRPASSSPTAGRSPASATAAGAR